MRIVEINAMDNGAHRNQNGGVSKVPEGWAIIPDDMELENFPFGEVTVEEVDGVPGVTGWTPGVIPEPEPGPDPEEPAAELTDAELAAAIREGVNEI